MQFRPIISAMRRNKVGAILIAVQMAITLAILCNALFIIQQRQTWRRCDPCRAFRMHLPRIAFP